MVSYLDERAIYVCRDYRPIGSATLTVSTPFEIRRGDEGVHEVKIALAFESSEESDTSTLVHRLAALENRVRQIESGFNKAMLELLYATGIRVTELIDLKITDVNLEAGVIRCVNRDTERFIPMYPAAVKALRDYITLVRPQMILSPGEQSLFVNISGEHMSRQGFWKIIKHYQKMAGIEKDITPHTLRHSFAAHLLENDADIHAVRDMLGHRDISSMQVYSKLVDKKIKDVYNKAHPRA